MDKFDHAGMTTYVWDGTAADRVHVSYVGGIRPYAFGEHGHAGFAEIVFVRHGILDHCVNGDWQRHGPGTVTLVRPGETHALRGERVEYLNISFDTQFIERLEPELRAALATPGSLVVRLPTARRALFEADAETLAAATSSALRAVMVLQLVSLIVSTRLQDLRSPVVGGPPWLARVRERLEEIDRPIPDLATLRQWAGVSAEHLARSVRQHLGCTPVRWLHQLRVRRGARLLAATDLAVGEIAIRCGYDDPGLFHRRFAAVHGCGPRAYRRREQRFVIG